MAFYRVIRFAQFYVGSPPIPMTGPLTTGGNELLHLSRRKRLFRWSFRARPRPVDNVCAHRGPSKDQRIMLRQALRSRSSTKPQAAHTYKRSLSGMSCRVFTKPQLLQRRGGLICQVGTISNFVPASSALH